MVANNHAKERNLGINLILVQKSSMYPQDR